MSSQEEFRFECFQPRDRPAQSLEIVIARRDQLVPCAVVDAVGENSVDDDRRPRSLVPQPDVAWRVPGQVQNLDDAARRQADRLAPAEPDVDRRVAAHRRKQLGGVHRREPVRRMPAVVLADERLVRLDPAPIELVAGEDRLRMGVAEGVVPADVVVVGVADQHEVRLQSGAAQVGVDHCRRRLSEAGVDQHRAVAAGYDVLAHEARPQVALDAVDPVGDLGHVRKEERGGNDPER